MRFNIVPVSSAGTKYHVSLITSSSQADFRIPLGVPGGTEEIVGGRLVLVITATLQGPQPAATRRYRSLPASSLNIVHDNEHGRNALQQWPAALEWTSRSVGSSLPTRASHESVRIRPPRSELRLHRLRIRTLRAEYTSRASSSQAATSSRRSVLR